MCPAGSGQVLVASTNNPCRCEAAGYTPAANQRICGTSLITSASSTKQYLFFKGMTRSASEFALQMATYPAFQVLVGLAVSPSKLC